MVKKEILVICEDFPPSFRGGDIVSLKDLLMSLDLDKFQISVFIPKNGNNYNYASIRVNQHGRLATKFLRQNGAIISLILFNFLFFLESFKDLRRSNPDVLISNGRNVILTAVLVKILKKKKLLINVRDPWPLCQFRTALNYYFSKCYYNSRFCIKCHYSWSAKYYGFKSRLILPFCFLSYFQQKIRTWLFKHRVNGVFTPSEFFKTILLSNYEKIKINTIPNAFSEINSLKKTIESTEINCIIFIGKVGYEKGILEFLKFVKQFPEMKIIIIGFGPLLKILKTQFPQYRWLGYVNHEFITNYLTHESLIFVPSVWPESFGRVPVECALLGTKVIVYRAGGLGELAKKINIWSVEVFNVKSAIRVVSHYLQSPSRVEYDFSCINPLEISRKFTDYLESNY